MLMSIIKIFLYKTRQINIIIKIIAKIECSVKAWNTKMDPIKGIYKIGKYLNHIPMT